VFPTLREPPPKVAMRMMVPSGDIYWSRDDICRYGDLDSLLALSVEHGELRTLLRVLAGGGEKGRACLLQLCSRFQVAAEGSGCDNPEVAAEGSGCDNPEVDLKGRGDSLLGRLPTQELYQFLYRSFLSLQKQGDAGNDKDSKWKGKKVRPQECICVHEVGV